MFAIANKGHKYVDRGDPENYDFILTDFTRDNAWHELDLSSIIPVNTVIVEAALRVTSSVAGVYVQFRKNGNSNVRNMLMVTTLAVTIINEYRGFVGCDNNLKIEYRASPSNITAISFTVCGWII